jgi:hypothetical protein
LPRYFALISAGLMLEAEGPSIGQHSGMTVITASASAAGALRPNSKRCDGITISLLEVILSFISPGDDSDGLLHLLMPLAHIIIPLSHQSAPL